MCCRNRPGGDAQTAPGVRPLAGVRRSGDVEDDDEEAPSARSPKCCARIADARSESVPGISKEAASSGCRRSAAQPPATSAPSQSTSTGTR